MPGSMIAACCEGPCAHEAWQDPDPHDPEVQAILLAELLAHWSNGPCEQWCSYCYEEWEIRRLGIEDVNLYDDYCRRYEAALGREMG